ncbi:Solute carrier family 23 member 1 [Acipenser ruthenus]|uniref:Solute carrier family 23 member 1 n=1 Tax=Acipenser ruthenus TaxID=7906 RepID=A0A662YY72_ACIRT|nr:Solute carrier family 23 member 1 [Acipenser ruthenus]
MDPEKELNGLDNYAFTKSEHLCEIPADDSERKQQLPDREAEQNKLAYSVTEVPPWLPILQGGTFTFLAPSLALLSMPQWKCPAWSQNANLVNTSSPEYIEVWQSRIREVLAGMTVSWLICYILTEYKVLPSDPEAYGYWARTDLKGDVLGQAPWFRFPYPGQWGMPTVSPAGVFGILAGVISSMIESVGDYHACARLSGAPPPPKHAINRGVGIEGIGCLMAGAWGTGNGTTSYSENVGALGITKVGSRMVIVTSGFLMICMGMFGKVAAIFTTIPTPVIGGMFFVMFGVIIAAGISNLQYTDMNSSRNIFVFGFSMFTGMAIPNWVFNHPGAIVTGVTELDQVLRVLLTTSMFVGGFFGFVLDNTIPGSKKERGIVVWKEAHQQSGETLESEEVYSLPFGIGSRICTASWVRYIPFCPKPAGTDSGNVGNNEDTIMEKTDQALPNRDTRL